MDWVILYSDGSTFSSDQGAWEDAPGRDVQVVIFRDPELGWTLRHGGRGDSGCDFFRMENGVPVGMDQAGMIDHVVHELGVVKQGRMLSPPAWQDTLRAALFLRNALREAEAEDGAT